MLIVAGTALVLLAAAYVFAPLFGEPRGNLEVELLAETELDRLLSRKAVVYTNLRDLELEYKMGRLGDDDFARLEADYKAEAAAILEKLDHLGVDSNIDEMIESDIASKRSGLFGTPAPEKKQALVCPACGAELAPAKRFCGDCGHKI